MRATALVLAAVLLVPSAQALFLPLGPLLGALPGASLPVGPDPSFALSLFPRSRVDLDAGESFDVSVRVAAGVGNVLYVAVVPPAVMDVTGAEAQVPAPGQEASFFPLGHGRYRDGPYAGRDFAEFLGFRKDGTVTGNLTLHLDARQALGEGTYTFAVTACEMTGLGRCTAKEVGTVSLILDATPPLVWVNATPDVAYPGWITTAPTLTIETVDNVSAPVVTYQIGSGAFTPYAAPFALGIERSYATVNVSVSDEAGNVQTLIVGEGASWIRNVDATPPTISLTPAATPAWSTIAPTLTVGFSDASSGLASFGYRVERDGVETVPWTSAAGTFPLPTTGNYTIELFAIDVAGLANGTLGAPLARGPYKVDLDLPAASVEVSPATPDGLAGWYVQAPSVFVNATDTGSGASQVRAQLDGAGAFVTGATGTSLSIPEGQHFVAYDATDAAGLATGTLRHPVGTGFLKVDLTPPTVTAAPTPGTPNGLNGWYRTAPTIAVTASDLTSGVTYACTVEGVAPSPATGFALPDGEDVDVHCDATDGAGWTAVPSDASYKVDTLAPVVDATAPATGVWHREAVSVALDVDDATSGISSVEYRLLVGGTTGAWTPYTAAVELPEGSDVRFEYLARDVAGNTAGATLGPFQVDITGVSSSLLDAPPAYIRNATHNLSWSPIPTTGVSGFSSYALEQRVDGGAWSLVENVTDVWRTWRVVDALQDGSTYEWQLTVWNHAENTSAPSTASTTVDLTPPAVVPDVPDAETSGWYTWLPEVSLDATDDGSGLGPVEVRLRDATTTGAWTAYAGGVSIPEGAETYLDYRAYDRTGQVTTGTLGPFAVDATTPDAPVLDAIPEFHNGEEIILRWTAFSTDGPSGFGSYVVEMDQDGNGFFELVTITDATELTTTIDGLSEWSTYAFRVLARSVAGLSGESDEVSTMIDLSPPYFDNFVTDPDGDGGWYVTPPIVTLGASDDLSGVDEVRYRVCATVCPDEFVLDDGSDIELPAEDGSFVEYYATDLAGNEGEVQILGPFSIDASTPGPLELGTFDAWTGGEGTVTLAWTPIVETASGFGQYDIEVNEDGNGWWWYDSVTERTTTTYDFSVSDGVTYEWRIVAWNGAGTANTSNVATTSVDLLAPETLATYPAPDGTNGWHRGGFDATLAASDAGSGVDTLVYRVVLPGSPAPELAAYAGPIAIPAVDGVLLEFQATDEVGNVETLQQAGPFRIDDATPPATSLVALPPFTTSASVDLSWDAVSVASPSGLANYTLLESVNGSAPAPVVTTTTTGATRALLHATTYSWVVRVRSGAGGANDSAAVGTLVDLSKPVTGISIDGSSTGGWYAAPPLVSLHATDTVSGVASLQYRVVTTGATPDFAEYAGEFPIPAGAGTRLEFFATDNASNVETLQQVTFNVDPNAPNASVLGALPAWLPASSVGLSWSPFSSEGSSPFAAYVVQQSVDAGATWTTLATITNEATTTLLVSGLADGASYRWRVLARNAAGLTSTGGSVGTTVDLTPPAVAATPTSLFSEGWLTDPSPVLTLTLSDATSGIAAGSAYNISIGGTLVATGALVAGANGIAIPEGRGVTVAWRAIDAAGLATTGSLTRDVDRTPPTSVHALAGGKASLWWLTPVNVVLSALDAASGPATLEYSLDAGATWTSYAGGFVVAGDGVHSIRHRATDAAGFASATTTVDIAIDTVPPTAFPYAYGAVGRNGWLTSEPTVVFEAGDATSGLASLRASLDDGATWFDATAPFPIRNAGAWTLRYEAEDVAGHVLVGQTTVRYDPVPPTLACFVEGASAGSTVYRAPAAIGLHAFAGPSRLASVDARLDGASVDLVGRTVPLAPGSHRLVARAVSGAGVVGPELVCDVTVLGDAAAAGPEPEAPPAEDEGTTTEPAPDAGLDAPTDEGALEEATPAEPRIAIDLPSVAGGGIDAPVHVEGPTGLALVATLRRPDGSAQGVELSEGRVRATLTAEGGHTLRLALLDGGREVAAAERSFLVVLAPPVIDLVQVTAATDGDAVLPPYEAIVRARDASGDLAVELTCDPACPLSVAGQLRIEAGGTYTIVARAVGATGLETRVERTVEIALPDPLVDGGGAGLEQTAVGPPTTTTPVPGAPLALLIAAAVLAALARVTPRRPRG